MAPQVARKLVDPRAPNDPSVESAFAAVPETMTAEILDGELHTQPRPAMRHTKVAWELGMELGPPFARGRGGPGGWIFRAEPELHFGPKPDKIVPDLAGWRVERGIENIGVDEDPAYYEAVPDWICEIVSPRTEATDRVKKMHLYRRERVAHVWLIQPRAHILEVYRFEVDHYGLVETFAGDRVVRAEPFDAVEISLRHLWIGDPETT